MSSPAHSPLPWDIHPEGDGSFNIYDSTGTIIAAALSDFVPEDEAAANAALIKDAVATHDQLIAMARRLAEPFEDITTDFLEEAASADPGSLHLIGGKGLTAHFARAILDARAAVAAAEVR